MAVNQKEIEKEQLVNYLKGIFKPVLDPEIVDSVALNCDYNETSTTNMLLELAKNVDGVNKLQLNETDKLANGSQSYQSVLAKKPSNSSPGKKQQKSSQNSPTKANKKKSEKELQFERLLTNIRQGYKVLVLMRGLPGSGKSTLARTIVDSTISKNYINTYEQYIKSTDDFFIINGIYVHDASRLTEAHDWNRRRAYDTMAAGISPVIIDNTNTQMWEMKGYAMIAMQFGYLLEIVEPLTPWAFNERELMRRNRHNVSRKKINEMLTRYEKNVTPQKMKVMYNLRYLVPVPQLRSFPPVILEHSSSNQFMNAVQLPSMRSQPVNGAIPRQAWEVVDLTDDLTNTEEPSATSTASNSENQSQNEEVNASEIYASNDARKAGNYWGTIDLTEDTQDINEDGNKVIQNSPLHSPQNCWDIDKIDITDESNDSTKSNCEIRQGDSEQRSQLNNCLNNDKTEEFITCIDWNTGDEQLVEVKIPQKTNGDTDDEQLTKINKTNCDTDKTEISIDETTSSTRSDWNENCKQSAPENWGQVDLMNFDGDSSNACDWNDTSNQSPNSSPLINKIFAGNDDNDTQVLQPNVLAHSFSEPEIKKLKKSTDEIHHEIEGEKDGEMIITTETEEEKESRNLRAKQKSQTTRKSVNIYPKLDLSSWGLSETTAYAWEPWEVPQFEVDDNKAKGTYVEMKDSFTNTDSKDFLLLSSQTPSVSEITVLTANNRDINEKTPSQSGSSSPPKKITLDKSSMTEDQIIANNLEEQTQIIDKHMEQLRKIFPNISVDLLRDVYEKCNRDVNWVVDLLLEGNLNLLDHTENESQSHSNEASEELQPNNTENDTDNTDCLKESIEEIRNYTEKISLQQQLDPPKLQQSNFSNIESSPSNSKNIEPTQSLTNAFISKGKELVKLIENKFVIGNQHYSDHLLKVKQSRTNGSPDEAPSSQEMVSSTQLSNEFIFTAKESTDTLGNLEASPSISSTNSTISKPSTYKLVEACQSFSTSISPQPSISAMEVCQSSYGDIIAIDADREFDDFESSISHSSSAEMMELNLSDLMVSQLEERFGDPDLYPKGFQPVIQIPVELAKQLFAFYLESVYTQMETQNQVMERLVKEDEEFAKRLQEEEARIRQEFEQQEIPDLREIMAEEQARNVYNRENEQWKKLTPDDLAAKLTRKKLFESFPNLDQNVLLEILHAHNNCYEQTIEVLLNSTNSEHVIDPNGTIRQPPISQTTLDEMRQAKKETVTEEPDNTEELRSANSYREEAQRHLTKKHELYQKAQRHYQKGEGHVAAYYRELAEEMGLLYDRANLMAAMTLLNDHSRRKDFHTLDLHYLFVKEAVSALDIFIDRNIMLVNGENRSQQFLFIITGRGKGSKDGRSRLRPAVMARLRKRNIQFFQMNPGLLKIKITRSSLMSNDIRTNAI